jgi:minor extracellular serine protease Vpr
MSRLQICFGLLAALIATQAAQATRLAGRYALILQDEPAARVVSGARRNTPAVAAARRSIQAKQRTLRDQLRARGVQVTASIDTVLNAVFVAGKPGDESELRTFPGVKRVVYLPAKRLSLNTAAHLVNAPNAWQALGGTGHAGDNIKIAVIDSGIDIGHEAFRDPALSLPAGFPKEGSDGRFTNNKVIVARSYVRILSEGFPSVQDATDSRPDDFSPRDRIGHGTAVAMAAAGNTAQGPLASITGMAPHAYLGNYKVFGSPQLNDFSTDDAIISALNDAFNDGMDIAVMSLGGPALSGPLDGSCGGPCDPLVAAIENVVAQGMTVVVAAGNAGFDGYNADVGYNTITSPGYAPSAITVGATTNSHSFFTSVHIEGAGVPANLASVPATQGDGPQLAAVFKASLTDGEKIGQPYGCSPYPAGAFLGAIVLIKRGNCSFVSKVLAAQEAGAVGVVITDTASNIQDLQMSGLANTSIPAFAISYDDGQSIRSYLSSSSSGVTAGLDPKLTEHSDSTANQVAYFSSRGPVAGTGELKPDIAAPGVNLYMAGETYDPNGDLYSATGYTVAEGTSFSTPIVAGLAALVQQKHPEYTASQVKSALVNTASREVKDSETGKSPASVLDIGGGRADGRAAIDAAVTVEPASVSFGILGAGFQSTSRSLTLVNHSESALTLALGVSRTNTDPATQVTTDLSTLVIAGGQSAVVKITLAGSKPAPGIYEGAVLIAGTAVSLHVPFLYIVGDGVPADLIPLAGDGQVGTVGQGIPDGYAVFKLVDQFGVAISGHQVTWLALNGGSITNAWQATDENGIAAAQITLPGKPGGPFVFRATVPGFTHYNFEAGARLQPAIYDSGVVNGASFAPGPIAPGSIVSIFGIGLGDTGSFTAAWTPLPIALNYVSISFDVPSAGISVPGALYYVSPRQINVQVPWELAGQQNVQIKVNNDFSSGKLYTAELAEYSPACFVSGSTSGGNFVAARDVNNGLITAANPAVPGQYVQLYCTGLGPVTNAPGSAEIASAAPLSETTTQPTVTIGGMAATVQFSGLAPETVGLYQVNVLVPEGLGSGSQPLQLAIGGVAAPTLILPVR